jgi:hypothetical protein
MRKNNFNFSFFVFVYLLFFIKLDLNASIPKEREMQANKSKSEMIEGFLKQNCGKIILIGSISITSLVFIYKYGINNIFDSCKENIINKIDLNKETIITCLSLSLCSFGIYKYFNNKYKNEEIGDKYKNEEIGDQYKNEEIGDQDILEGFNDTCTELLDIFNQEKDSNGVLKNGWFNHDKSFENLSLEDYKKIINEIYLFFVSHSEVNQKKKNNYSTMKRFYVQYNFWLNRHLSHFEDFCSRISNLDADKVYGRYYFDFDKPGVEFMFFMEDNNISIDKIKKFISNFNKIFKCLEKEINRINFFNYFYKLYKKANSYVLTIMVIDDVEKLDISKKDKDELIKLYDLKNEIQVRSEFKF